MKLEFPMNVASLFIMTRLTSINQYIGSFIERTRLPGTQCVNVKRTTAADTNVRKSASNMTIEALLPVCGCIKIGKRTQTCYSINSTSNSQETPLFCPMPLNVDLDRLFLLLSWCFTALRHFLCQFGCGHLTLTYPHCSWTSLLSGLPVLSGHYFARN